MSRSRSEAAKKAWITRRAGSGVSSGPTKLASARKVQAADFFAHRTTMHDVHVADVYLGKAPPRKSDPFEVWLSKRKAKR